ncbi:MAG: hypothetical protein QXL86_02915 [Candidatus Aenigmatarchaeota archaeon]
MSLSAIDAEYINFLGRLEAIREAKSMTKFSVVEYPDKNAVLFQILLPSPQETVKFHARIRVEDWANVESGSIALYFNKLFKQEMIRGKIKIEEIMRDAIPAYSSLKDFFCLSPNSIYKDSKNPPVGLHFGNLAPTSILENKIDFILEDFNQDYNITGLYSIETRDKSLVKDPWGKDSMVLYLTRQRISIGF